MDVDLIQGAVLAATILGGAGAFWAASRQHARDKREQAERMAVLETRLETVEQVAGEASDKRGVLYTRIETVERDLSAKIASELDKLRAEVRDDISAVQIELKAMRADLAGLIGELRGRGVTNGRHE